MLGLDRSMSRRSRTRDADELYLISAAGARAENADRIAALGTPALAKVPPEARRDWAALRAAQNRRANANANADADAKPDASPSANASANATAWLAGVSGMLAGGKGNAAASPAAAAVAHERRARAGASGLSPAKPLARSDGSGLRNGTRHPNLALALALSLALTYP